MAVSHFAQAVPCAYRRNEFLARVNSRYVAQGLSKAGANQYSFLKSQGAHNTSGAVLDAENTNVHWPVSTFKELTDKVEKTGYKHTSMVEWHEGQYGGSGLRRASQTR